MCFRGTAGKPILNLSVQTKTCHAAWGAKLKYSLVYAVQEFVLQKDVSNKFRLIMYQKVLGWYQFYILLWFPEIYLCMYFILCDV